MRILARSAVVTLLVTQLTVVSARGQEAGARYCAPSLPAYNVDTFPEFDYETECAKCLLPEGVDNQRVAVINSCIDQEALHKQVSQSLWYDCPPEGRRAAIARQEHTFKGLQGPQPNQFGEYIYKKQRSHFAFFYALLEDSLQGCVEKARLYNKRPGVDY